MDITKYKRFIIPSFITMLSSYAISIHMRDYHPSLAGLYAIAGSLMVFSATSSSIEEFVPENNQIIAFVSAVSGILVGAMSEKLFLNKK